MSLSSTRLFRPAGSRPLRWGIIGTARIATKVAEAIHGATGAELVAVASRDKLRAAEWATAHRVPVSYGHYDELLNDPDIDAVYIPLPPSMHCEWTIRAAEKKKHVLCEKPLAMTAAEGEEMWAACRVNGVQLMDGVMWLHHPRTAAMKANIRDGSLGKICKVTSGFSFCWNPLPLENIRMQYDLGGGSLGDLGWYCVGVALWSLNKQPVRVFGSGRYVQNVDVHFNALMWYDDECVASFDCGFDTTHRKWFELAGTECSLVCDDFVKPRSLEKIRFWLHRGDDDVTETVSAPLVQEVCMIEDFCQIVRSGEFNDHWPRIAIETQRVCDALDRSARSGQVVDLA
ncbi:MAG: Gfo/Idh/MocA family oxidoreductase [Planctomycetota bacterium]|nr:Gfo/Idh/MocA family oxidoreductase [Planctomycetota bacterium]MDA1211018.1 Gfo/Idh/MocA family oxidoreductase [Planctomycetota bacterium]